jgi:hypothetical protein
MIGGRPDIKMHIPESQNSRDLRIEKLWSKLDPQKKGEIDVNGLRKGLHAIDHREFSNLIRAAHADRTCSIEKRR